MNLSAQSLFFPARFDLYTTYIYIFSLFATSPVFCNDEDYGTTFTRHLRAQLENSLFCQKLTTWRLPPAPVIRHSGHSALYKSQGMNEWMNEWKDVGITVDGNNFKRKTWGNISVFHVIASTYSEHWTAQLEHLSSLVRSHLQCWLMMLQRVKKADGAWTVASTVAVQRSRAVIRWRAPARVLQAGLVATVIHVSESMPVTILAKVVIWWHHNFYSGKNSRTVAFIAIFLPRNDVC